MEKNLKVIFIIFSLLFIFACEKNNKLKINQEEDILNNKIIETISYTETERNISDFDSKISKKRNFYIQKTENDIKTIIENDENDISLIVKNDNFTELYQNGKMTRKIENQKRKNNNKKSEIVDTLFENKNEITNFLSKEIILNNLSKYIVSIDENKIYKLKENKGNCFTELNYNLEIERVLSIVVIDKIDNKYEEVKTEYFYETIEGTHLLISKIITVDIRDTFEKHIKTEKELIEEASYLLGIDANKVRMISDRNRNNSSISDTREVPIIISKNSDVKIINYSNINLNTDKINRKFKNIKGVDKNEK